ncbi:hypothetical protein GCM10027256_31140 [Novispirillum itersonii subsp. nipponicum]
MILLQEAGQDVTAGGGGGAMKRPPARQAGLRRSGCPARSGPAHHRSRTIWDNGGEVQEIKKQEENL